MAEFFLELFSEEIPARMQVQGSDNLAKIVTETFKDLEPKQVKTFSGPRRIALTITINESIPARKIHERGPRSNAPEKALQGFLRKHQANQSDLTEENGFWVLHKQTAPINAADFIAQNLPQQLWKFTWPKSQRWGNGSQFTWVRPLHRIVCLLNGQQIPFSLATREDDGHTLKSGNQTEGHRFLNPHPFEVLNATHWQSELYNRHVIVDVKQRREQIQTGLTKLAAQKNLTLVHDQGLLNEVTGLVEWPVPLLGQIDPQYMDLPSEVMQVSMRINQRYFALRTTEGSPAAYFAFVANILPEDNGELIIAGNERVLRARFADARYFWDLDRKTPLSKRVDSLKGVIFHANLGTQYDRVQRIIRMADFIACLLQQDSKLAKNAALLCKADLTTGMVGEFPELQGIMGGYYARHDGEVTEIVEAIRDHYKPCGPNDNVPKAPISIIVALADKIDLMTAFFAIGQKPSGSGDPFALRRAALGIIRIIRENQLRLNLQEIFDFAAQGLPESLQKAPDLSLLSDFIAERLYVQLRSEGARYDVLAAVSNKTHLSDLIKLLNKTDAVAKFIETDEGNNLLATAKRAHNILRIENKKDGPHQGSPAPSLFQQEQEKKLYQALQQTMGKIKELVQQEQFENALKTIATLRPVVDQFFEDVTINDEDSKRRRNRLKLLSQINEMTDLVADFNQIEK